MPEKPPFPDISIDAGPREQVSLLRVALALAIGYAKELEAKLEPFSRPQFTQGGTPTEGTGSIPPKTP
jgi:hypothetical protein